MATTKSDNDCESDEDCEVYFLKPVNEYNIVDKIKEANKELFSADSSPPTSPTMPATALPAKDVLAEEVPPAAVNRKVTFALNLEDYEPAAAADDPAGVESAADMDRVADELAAKLLLDFQFTVIDEEDDEPSNRDQEAHRLQEHNATMPAAVGEGEDEIGEEIVGGDVAEAAAAATPPLTGSLVTVQSVHRRRHTIMKQDTFAYDDVDEIGETECGEIISEKLGGGGGSDNDNDGDPDEPDNRSMSNLLTTSDCEEDEEAGLARVAAEKGVAGGGHTVDSREFEYDDDDDDKLSIIVASYISDDDDDDDHDHNAARPSKTRKNSGGKSRRILPFGKRFSLRRKLNGGNNDHRIGTCGSGSGGGGIGRTGRSNFCTSSASSPPPAHLSGELKLNYKTCCEHRHSLQAKQLPKYTGYLSEYGLSRDQLAQRQELRERQQRFILETTLRADAQEMRKMQDNERAFTTWLKNKMRFPANKTRNMFDVKSSARNMFVGDKATTRARNTLDLKTKTRNLFSEKSKVRNMFDVKSAISGCTSLAGVVSGNGAVE